jgi:hypothetical protein
MVAAAATNAFQIRWQTNGILIQRNAPFLDSFQCAFSISLELLQNTAFPFASRRPLKYR